MRVIYSKISSVPVSAIILFLLAFLLAQPAAYSQVVNSKTKKKISIGFGLHTDILQKVPAGVKVRTINQGISVFGLYNMPFGKSNFGFSIGLGLTSHNVFGNFLVDKVGDTTKLVKIPDSVSYKRSKMTIVYAEIPVEFNLKTKSKFNCAIGFKAGFMIGSKSVYVGDGGVKTFSWESANTGKIRVKTLGIPNLEQFAYGPTARIGYKWINVDCYYMLSTFFNKNRGPELYPISVGIVIMPF
ncbi:MAG: outer membrane beta-barrel protein [Bacteroidetes bacterium]|nr:outer membrane beta-barrel protein [Bacteroidota bacterium]